MSHRIESPNLANDNVWDDVVKKVKAKGRETLKKEQKLMLERGIIDDAGRSIYKDLPQDMTEHSRTSVAT